MTISRDQYLREIVAESEALALAAEGSLDARVPACPEWSMADLVWHVGAVHNFWGQIVERRLQSPADGTRPQRPPDEDLIGMLRAGVPRLVETLRDADDAASIWGWSRNKTIGFVPRRMAQETMVHRFDGEAAAGIPGGFEMVLAADGVDEFLDLFIEADDRKPDFGGNIRIETTDTGEAWTVMISEAGLRGSPVMREAPNQPDATIKGTAEELLLALWRRRPVETLSLTGDRRLGERFIEWTDLA
ncbi:MAG: maleylpyruvate isomerase family mycothiol-dependent enzyme [Actinomycetota bacterium]